MQVHSLSPMYNSYVTRSFCGKNKENGTSTSSDKFSRKEINVAKTKKVASECVTLALGAASLYFLVKKLLKTNKLTEETKKLIDTAMKKPVKEAVVQVEDELDRDLIAKSLSSLIQQTEKTIIKTGK